MKRRTQQFVAAFVVTGIVIFALCGFMVVDLSTDRYLSTAFGPLFQVTGIDRDGIRFAAMGEYHEISADRFAEAREQVWSWRGLLPGSVNLTANLVTRGCRAARDYLQAQAAPEEIW